MGQLVRFVQPAGYEPRIAAIGPGRDYVRGGSVGTILRVMVTRARVRFPSAQFDLDIHAGYLELVGGPAAEPPVAVAEKRVRGRPPTIDAFTEGWVHWRHRQGATMRQIMQELEEWAGPAPNGGHWQVSTIQRILARDPGRPRVSRPQPATKAAS